MNTFSADETRVLKALAAGLLGATGGATPPAGDDVASDYDLDGQYGDVEIRKDPPRWKGESMVGKRYSETSSEYLMEMASFLKWKAGKNEEDAEKARKEGDAEGAAKAAKYGGFALKDRGRALGWATRLRARAKTEPAPEAEDNLIPF